MSPQNRKPMKQTPQNAGSNHGLGRPKGWRRGGYVMAVAVSIGIVGGPIQADDVAQQPLDVTLPLPNVAFTLDDSGSMHWESIGDSLTAMPDGNRGSVLGGTAGLYMFPRAEGIYGGGDYQNYVPRFSGNDEWSRIFRAAEINPQYYDPDQQYRPWLLADGDRMPEINPECAPHNPWEVYQDGVGPGTRLCAEGEDELGGRDLTEENTEWANWLNAGENNSNWQNKTFFPATYFEFSGDADDEDDWFDPDHFEQVEIDPADTEEMQNFANWYSYHRSRILAARAGIGEAFIQQGQSMRTAFGSINTGRGITAGGWLCANPQDVDGEDTCTLQTGVREFDGQGREDFIERLYGMDVPAGATPLRGAAHDVGEYFSRDDDQGPWSTTPGEAGGEELACRRNYHILMSDGYWNAEVNDNVGNVDNTTGPLIQDEDGETFQYQPEGPFSGQHSNTLADYAMKYWNQDLREDLPNILDPVAASVDQDTDVVERPGNPAFWPHMVTYTVGLGVFGSIDRDQVMRAVYDYDEDGTTTDVDWGNPHPDESQEEKIDDMLHAAVNTRGDFFSALDVETFSDELGGVLRDIMERRGGTAAVATNSAQLDTDTLVFQAFYDTDDWSGEFRALELTEEGEIGDQVAEAGNVLWQGYVQDPGNGPPVPRPRNILVAEDSQGYAVDEWQDLPDGLQEILEDGPTGSSDLSGPERWDWIAGHRVDGARERSTPLGPIINSDPAFVADQFFEYSENLEDDSYREFFEETVSERDPMIYVGASDGMLHGFSAETAGTTLEERFAFIPEGVHENLPELPEPGYEHRYFVDGAPTVVDAHVDGEWRSILVNSLGAGGGSIFALDVTDPDELGEDSLLWEITEETHGFEQLGYSFGEPTIARLEDGTWAAFFGNGYGSEDEEAILYVVDLEDGELLETLETGESGGNGMSAPIAVDTTGDNVAERVVAGDLHGNLWKVDVSDANDIEFKYSQGGDPLEFFHAQSEDGERQPITTRPAVTEGRSPGQRTYLFGTGQYFAEGDDEVGPNPRVESFYGVMVSDDTNINNANAILDRDDLLEQELLVEVDDPDLQFAARGVSQNDLGPDDDGWYLDLVYEGDRAGERVVNDASVRGDRVFFTTLIPPESPCDVGGDGWLMELDATSGSRLDDIVFDLTGEGDFGEDDLIDAEEDGDEVTIPASGVRSRTGGAPSQPAFVGTDDDEMLKVLTADDDDPEVVRNWEDLGQGRQSWRALQ